MNIVTNNHERKFCGRWEVPASVLNDQFDYLTGDEGTFCKYRGVWYSRDLFVSGGPEGYDGYHGDSYFSGVAIKLDADGDGYKVATVYQVG